MGPLSINHLGQLPAVDRSLSTSLLMPLWGDAVDQITGLSRQMLPSSVDASFQGNAQAFQSSFERLGLLLVMAIAVIYIVLGICMESFHPPHHDSFRLALRPDFGALLSLELCHLAAQKGWVSPQTGSRARPVRLSSAYHADRHREKECHHDDLISAVERSGNGKRRKKRFTKAAGSVAGPLHVTTMAALVGTLPIALGFGAERRRAARWA